MNQIWPELRGAGHPVDSHVGPFTESEFLEAWWAHLGSGNPFAAGDHRGLLAVVESEGVIRCAGEADVTDYHSVRGDNFDGVARALLDARSDGQHVILDSLPERSALGLASALQEHECPLEPQREGPGTAVIEVAADYLGELPKKQRHELRRKRRRYEEAVGSVNLEVTTGLAPMRTFVELHRTSQGEKGDFFDDRRVRFFHHLAELPGWEFAELRAGGVVAASLFGYRALDSYYLYNSAYDLTFREVSPGIVVLYSLIEQLVESGCRRIDLLKGDEAYKFRMGATERPLYTLKLP